MWTHFLSWLLLDPHASLLWYFPHVLLIGVGHHSLYHVLYRLFRILYHLFRQVSWWTWFELVLGSVWNCSGWISIIGIEWKKYQLTIWQNLVIEWLLFQRRFYQWIGLEGRCLFATLLLRRSLLGDLSR